MGIGGIGPLELIIVLVIALIVLGPKRLPEAGKAIGHGLREFKDSIAGRGDDDDDDDDVRPQSRERISPLALADDDDSMRRRPAPPEQTS